MSGAELSRDRELAIRSEKWLISGRDDNDVVRHARDISLCFLMVVWAPLVIQHFLLRIDGLLNLK